ncbi:M16 family metallopeptidase [Nitrospirota bacterium]
MSRHLIIFVLSLFLAAPAMGGMDVKREVLPNGLTLLHMERHNLPVVIVSLLIKSGATEEPEELAGLASLTASLMNEGTKKRTSQQISEEIEFMGASLGASGGKDYSSISLSILKKDIDKGFELFSDILLHPVFAQDEITRKVELSINSLKSQEERPGFLAGREYIKNVFKEHPYGRLTSGTPATLENIKRKDIQKFHKTYFRPNNSILTVVGDINAEEVDALIKKYLKGWKKKNVPQASLPEIKPTVHKVVKIDRDLTQATIYLGHSGVTREHPDYYALSVMNYVLGGGGFSSRLMDKVRDDMGLAYGIHSSLSASKHGGSFTVSVQTRNDAAGIVIEEILNQIKSIRSEGITADELEGAKAFLTGSFPRRIDTMGKIASFLSQVEFHGLGLTYPEDYPRYINAVTLEDIKRVARTHLSQENYALVIVANQSKAALK